MEAAVGIHATLLAAAPWQRTYVSQPAKTKLRHLIPDESAPHVISPSFNLARFCPFVLWPFFTDVMAFFRRGESTGGSDGGGLVVVHRTVLGVFPDSGAGE